MFKSRILVADDEPKLLHAIESCLRQQGYEVLIARNGLEALNMAKEEHPDLIILDVMMPKMTGLQVCASLRKEPNFDSTPVLFLTALKEVDNKIEGLDEGADDYLVKPFDVGEFTARVRALLRQSKRYTDSEVNNAIKTDSRIIHGSLSLEPETQRVTVNNKTTQLTPVEYDLLVYLIENAGTFVTSDQLLENVWNAPEGTADTSLVRWHMRNLRAKIEKDPSNPTFIRTVARHGYIIDHPDRLA